MKTLTVAVKPDHLEKIAVARNPVGAIAELVWNGLDADATEVRVAFEENLLTGTDAIVVADNGIGISADEVEKSFTSLGGSWKLSSNRSRQLRRILHGRGGKGRFKAFALGAVVEWTTVYITDQGPVRQTITGRKDDLSRFQVSDPVAQPAGTPSGTTVRITEIHSDRNLRTVEHRRELTEELALYLRQYTDIRVYYDSQVLAPAEILAHEAEYDVATDAAESGEALSAKLTVIEWSIPASRSLFLCDMDGFTHDRMSPGIRAPHFQFTAHLRSEYIAKLAADNRLDLAELDPNLRSLVGAARDQLRTHFRSRATALAAEVVSDWRKRGIYPYSGEPQAVADAVQRQVFDVVALNVNAYLPAFAEADDKSQRFQLSLLRQALESSPEAAQRIVGEVLQLPKEKQEELAELLDRTSLSHLISASKVVADRLNFLRGLETLLFDKESKKLLRERSQLHKILEKNTWLFGEQFNLTVSDKSLDDVLRKHLHILGREPEKNAAPVRLDDGSVGIVDLMLSRKRPTQGANKREHLVVELKRPSVTISLDVTSQIQRYALAVARDERFRSTDTTWRFIAISNELTEDARDATSLRDKPRGLLFDGGSVPVQVWVQTWADIIEDNQSRLAFFQQELGYEATDETAIAHLKALHGAYLPATDRFGKPSPPSSAVKQEEQRGGSRPPRASVRR